MPCAHNRGAGDRVIPASSLRAVRCLKATPGHGNGYPTPLCAGAMPDARSETLRGSCALPFARPPPPAFARPLHTPKV